MKKKTEKKVKEAIEACCEEDWSKKKCDWKSKCSEKPCGGCVYILGIIGAAIYYISASTGFWGGVVAFLKALIWPTFLVLELFKFLGA